MLKDEFGSIKNALANKREYSSPAEKEPVTLLFGSSFQLGTATVFMMDLSYMLETDSEEKHKNIKNIVTPFNNIGKLEVIWTPIEPVDGMEGEELIGHPWTYKLQIKSAIGLPMVASLAYCQYAFFGEEFTTESVQQNTRTPLFDYEAEHHVDCVTPEFLKYLQEGGLQINVFATPAVTAPADAVSTANPAIIEAITGLRADAPLPVLKSRTANKLVLAKAFAEVCQTVAEAMDRQETLTEIPLDREGSPLNDPTVQDDIVKRLKVINPEWEEITNIADRNVLRLVWGALETE
jgi:hypothetical protein